MKGFTVNAARIDRVDKRPHETATGEGERVANLFSLPFFKNLKYISDIFKLVKYKIGHFNLNILT